MKRPHTKYLKTLRRIPDDIILDVAARDLDLMDGQQCICGWVIRDLIASTTGASPEETDAYDWDGEWSIFSPASRCAKAFGGTRKEWNAIYHDVADLDGGRDGDVELAFVYRVKEAVGV